MNTIGIIGFGRFGALWATLLPQTADILVFEPNIDIQIPSAYTRVSRLAEVSSVDVLFLLVPISALKTVCMQVAPLVRPDTLVCDVASVKVRPLEWMQLAFGNEQPLAYTHPLFGPDSVARTGTATKKIVLSTESCDRGKTLIRAIAKAAHLQVVETTAVDHDKQMARSQSLVHFIGRGLAPLELKEQLVATPDYERLLAMVSLVEHDTLELFQDMQRFNPFAKDMRSALLAALHDLEESL